MSKAKSRVADENTGVEGAVRLADEDDVDIEERKTLSEKELPKNNLI